MSEQDNKKPQETPSGVSSISNEEEVTPNPQRSQTSTVSGNQVSGGSTIRSSGGPSSRGPVPRRAQHDTDAVGRAMGQIMAALQGLSQSDRLAALKGAGAVYNFSVSWANALPAQQPRAKQVEPAPSRPKPKPTKGAASKTVPIDRLSEPKVLALKTTINLLTKQIVEKGGAKVPANAKLVAERDDAKRRLDTLLASPSTQSVPENEDSDKD